MKKNLKYIKAIDIKKKISWFNWYDTQTVQYLRDIRLFGKSDINIKELDKQAVENAKTIKTLRAELEELRTK